MEKWYKTSVKFPNFTDFEGQHLAPGEVKQLIETPRVLQAVKEGLIEVADPPVEETTDKTTNESGPTVDLKEEESESNEKTTDDVAKQDDNHKTNVRKNQGKGKE